jgi:hypothetical protein
MMDFKDYFPDYDLGSQDRIPASIRKLPSLPRGIDKWVLDNYTHSYMIFDRKADDMFCMHCGKHFKIGDAVIRHRKSKYRSYDYPPKETTGTCPHCGHSVKYKDVRYSREKLIEMGSFLIFTRKGKAIYAQYFWMTLDYSGNTVKVVKWPRSIYVISHKSQVQYVVHDNPYWGLYVKSQKSFKLPENAGYLNCIDFLLCYTDNFDTLFQRSDLKYNNAQSMWSWSKDCIIKDKLWPRVDHVELSINGFLNYLKLAVKYPGIEVLEKAGFEPYVWLKAMGYPIGAGINLKQTSLRGVFGLNMQEINSIREQGIHPQAVQIYKRFKKMGDPISLNKATRLMQEFNGAYGIKASSALNIATKRSKKNPTWVLAYLKKQGFSLADYRDHLDMIEKLNYSLDVPNILFPDDLAAVHEAYSIKCESQKKKIQNKIIAATARKIVGDTDPYYSDDLMIRPAMSAQEISREGRSLHHCVASYADKMARGGCVIMLIRKADSPDLSYYTLELNPKLEVMQVRGGYNCTPTPDVAAFVNEWLGWLKAQKQNKKKSKQKTNKKLKGAA